MQISERVYTKETSRRPAALPICKYKRLAYIWIWRRIVLWHYWWSNKKSLASDIPLCQFPHPFLKAEKENKETAVFNSSQCWTCMGQWGWKKEQCPTFPHPCEHNGWRGGDNASPGIRYKIRTMSCWHWQYYWWGTG